MPGEARVTRELRDEDWLSSGSLLKRPRSTSVWHGGVVFDEVVAGFDVDDGGGGFDFDGNVEDYRYEGSDVDIVRMNGESWGSDFHMVGIERHIGELVVSAGVRRGFTAESADRIVDGDGRSGDDCAGDVSDGSVNASGVAC